MNKAQELKQKADAVQEQRELEEKKKAQTLYEELLPEFEKVAADGKTKYFIHDSVLWGCSLSTLNSLFADEGFVTNQVSNGLNVRWDSVESVKIRVSD